LKRRLVDVVYRFLPTSKSTALETSLRSAA
jgi:hypothetical protein